MPPASTNPSQFLSEVFRLFDGSDVTKKTKFILSGITSGNTRELTIPDQDGVIALVGHSHEVDHVHDNKIELDKLSDGDHDVIVSGNPHGVIFLDLTDTPDTYDSEDIGKYLRLKDDLSGLEFAECEVGASTFIDLTDTPDFYESGDSGKFITIKDDLSGLEFTDNNSVNWNIAYGWGDHAGLYDVSGTAASAISTHLGNFAHANIAINKSHTDTTHDYAYISGNDGGTGITAAELEELSDGSETTLHSHGGRVEVFLDLTDTPASYDSEDIGRILIVKDDLSGLEFTDFNADNWDTAFGWGNHVGLYDATGTAVSTMTTHLDNFTHADIALNTTHRGLVAGNPHSVTPAELSLVIGTNTQAHDAGLDSLAALGYVSDSMIKITAEDTYAIRTMAEVKSDLTLNLVENTAHSTDAHTMTIDGRDVSVDGTKLDGIEALADVTATAETSHADVLVDGDFGSAGLMFTDGAGGYSLKAIGTDVQAYDAELAGLAALNYAAASFVKMTGVGTFALRTIGETADDLEGTIDHDQLVNGGAHDYAYISGNDGATGITAAELEELSDGSETTLHSHAGGGTFLDLTDTPATYDSSDVGMLIRVKDDLSGLEFTDAIHIEADDDVVLSGKLGIGKPPVGMLDITGTLIAGFVYKNTNNASYAQINLQNDAGEQAYLGISGSAVAGTWADLAYLNAPSGHALGFCIGGALKLKVASDGVTTIEETLKIKERAAAVADTAAYAQVYAKNDAPNTLWFVDDTGVEHQLGGYSSRCRVGLSSSQTLPTASTDVMEFDDEDFDDNNEFASYKFTATNAGQYVIVWDLFCDGLSNTPAGVYLFGYIFKNNVQQSSKPYYPMFTGASAYVGSSDVLELAANDYITIKARQTSGGNKTMTAFSPNKLNWIAVHRLS